MKKKGLLILITFILILSVGIVVAQTDDEKDKVDAAYSCLRDKVVGKCDSISSLEDLSFSLLALGECKSELNSKKSNDNCWPSTGCKLKDTALAILALDRVKADTSDPEKWLLSQKKIPEELVWYLEIDPREAAACEITYGSTDVTVNIGEDKKIDSDAGSCLTLVQENYWLEIDDSCYGENFTVRCNKDFLTALIYKKQGGDTVYVSSETKSASADGKTQHKVNSYCFKQGTSCDYEGSLWTTFALSKTNNDISGYLPYLMAMADESENDKYLPSAFLLLITDYYEYMTTLVNKQKIEGYWQTTSTSDKYYDTALALHALYELNVQQAENAKTYLLGTQGDNGCWKDNIKDTAFILFAAWPRDVGTGNGGDIPDCEEYKHSCESQLDCDEADVLDSFYCHTGVCCEVASEEKTCEERAGEICKSGEECSGTTVTDADNKKCCLGTCTTPSINTCESKGYYCRASCYDSEEEQESYTSSCDSGDFCCGEKPPKPGYLWIIILLIILIILVVLAIIFRNQLKIWLFRIKNKFKRGPAPSRAIRPGPGFPPAPPGYPNRMMPRMILPQQRAQARPVPRARSKTDRELEETLKKLKEMAK